TCPLNTDESDGVLSFAFTLQGLNSPMFIAEANTNPLSVATAVGPNKAINAHAETGLLQASTAPQTAATRCERAAFKRVVSCCRRTSTTNSNAASELIHGLAEANQEYMRKVQKHNAPEAIVNLRK